MDSARHLDTEKCQIKGARVVEGGFSPAAVPSYELPEGILVKGCLML